MSQGLSYTPHDACEEEDHGARQAPAVLGRRRGHHTINISTPLNGLKLDYSNKEILLQNYIAVIYIYIAILKYSSIILTIYVT